MSQFPGTGLLDPPPDESGDPEYNLAKRARDAGMTREQYVKLRTDAIRLTGKVLRWDSATYDQAFLALALVAEETWGIKQ